MPAKPLTIMIPEPDLYDGQLVCSSDCPMKYYYNDDGREYCAAGLYGDKRVGRDGAPTPGERCPQYKGEVA